MELIDKICRSIPVISRDKLWRFFRSQYLTPNLFQFSGFSHSLMQSPLGIKIILENSKKFIELLKGNDYQRRVIVELISLISKGSFSELDWGVEKKNDLISFIVKSIEKCSNVEKKEATLKLMVELKLL